MLLSKNPDRFLPKGWPVYFKKAKGCEVWDLDGNKYFDLSLMGLEQIYSATLIVKSTKK